MHDVEQFARHTAVTDLGAVRQWSQVTAIVPTDIPAVVRGLVVHMDQAIEVPDERGSHEPKILRVEQMLERLRDLDAAPLPVARPMPHRLVGHCRTTSVLACALYRELAVPARARVGFAAYYADGRDFYGDHWLVEVWDASEARWRRTDPELDESTRLEHQITFDPDDVPLGEFIPAGRGWLDCRFGAANAETFGPYPDATGWTALAAQLGRDAASLAGTEVGPFDVWLPPTLSDSELVAMDELAEATLIADIDTVGALRATHAWLCEPE